ncbi:hypothetical protein GLAREA_06957 [Glarea lozoyensis ATCC 20868]|uniref:Uncharacterized protein n=1 Tax=Glarea lozoyensis (strain ATCC 20868 / MF5171) TaxID=1116229 RepID=S3D9Y4_GLAL2|nr:uncharacterized protein GLAREA_06957 [Glarea lozoyensis ATCC 20868]EPE33944.1 hypothetical protein GLAREA_06957 [Glarea lozoyensis ATCC 20868]
MPPSISSGSVGAITRLRCPNLTLNPRSFSTTTSLSSIGPENPRFIEIPTSAQPQAPPRRVIKGVLPIPRNIFRKSDATKITPQYLAATSPKAKHKKEPQDDHVAWKRKMAAARRKNLQEGLLSLHARKLKSDRMLLHKSTIKQKLRAERFNAPQREDERLTNPTITKAMSQLQVGHINDARREERIEEMKARVAKKEAIREEERQNALHTLYMHARSFIVNEQQLDARIEEIFTEKPFFGSQGNNIWDAQGQPKSVQEMLAEINKTQKNVVDRYAGPAIITGKRMQKIAEELTGGKME